MDADKENDLRELKTELVIVVDALNVLQDFIESIFGNKYKHFVNINQFRSGEGVVEGSNTNAPGTSDNIQSALRKLRWKHSKSSSNFDNARKLSTPPGGPASRESKGDNGYSSAGGTPVTAIRDEGRRDSESSLNNKKLCSPPEVSVSVKNEENVNENSSSRFSLSVGRPEIVAVKCEVEDTDFLDDMDPFGSEHGDYHYEGDESDLKIDDCYPLSSDQDNQHLFQGKSPVTSEHQSSHSNSSPRFIPELIPIQSDPLLQSAPPTNPMSTPVTNKDDDEESVTSLSDNSDTEWQPSSSLTNVSSKRVKNDKQKSPVSKRPVQPDRKPSTSSTNCHSNFQASFPRHHTTTLMLPSTGYNGGSGVGGPFKCDMCSASYKQEESLRSHQKYKHNPSRVQCTCHLCGKSMVDKYRLQRHLRLHTGEKPFECEYCGQSFYRKDYHTKHLQRKHGISYNSGAGTPSKITKKLVPTKSKSAISSSPSSSFVISSIASGSSSSYQNLRSGVFETPSPPSLSTAVSQRKSIFTSSLAGQNAHRHSCLSTTTSPSSSSTSSVTTSSSTVSAGEMTAREHANFVNMFSSHLEGRGEGVSDGGASINYNEYCSSSGEIGNLMTMTSLTFDDLISADL